MHDTGTAASPWIVRWGQAARRNVAAPPSVLDVACGSGRHVRWWRQQGARVTALDRDAIALAGLRDLADEVIEADIEARPWPLPGRTFDVVMVTNYLWRPLLPTLVASVAPGGWLLYETFARGQETIGRPARAEFLLAPGELLDAVRAGPEPLRVVAFEDGFSSAPDRFVQRIAAVRCPPTAAPARYPL